MPSSPFQGYGLTETCACATLLSLDDVTTNRVGSPLSASDIKLVDWEEGNYRITDKPNPRGEVVIGKRFPAEGFFLSSVVMRLESFSFTGSRGSEESSV